MKYALCFVSSLLVISFILLLATEMNLVEARVNGERSKTYVICGNERVCNWTCIFNEHFTRGRCRHLYCYCFR
ncbi:hypothetical protein IGI04_007900 [Brassica rapa subsp. trilocularis]|uniref:BnaA02g26220D protein n=4 Tax=Brassica TaxID=3705 RepID=A0A078FBS5_BRANA|nr:hypothetical protein IGI04_007900 [Brassica rapa subsp. trilocularis]KAH0847088.1 hypothetical protein HID58_090507 [Brassica napus]CAG7895098.1 unnamed protein product [Brassica rapa]CAF2143079.1 unnamed protein product [Brassica napus]CDY09388.1 BnaA02g26220D [Brassica napus]